MKNDTSPWLRQRRLPVSALPTDLDLSKLAARAGIENIETADEALNLTYDLRVLGLEQIFTALAFDTRELSLFERIRWSLARFQESIHREDLNYASSWDSIVREIYVTHYRSNRRGGPLGVRRQPSSNEKRRASEGAAKENPDG